jgi:hypothetical protein
MSFTEALEQAKAEYSKGPTCTVALILKSHPDADEIKTAIDECATPGTVIARALEATGSKVKAEAIQRHRRKACGCGRQ